MAIFKGAGVAMVTPMKGNGEINYEALGALIDDQIANHTDAIIICGTTGEAPTLEDDEHLEAIGFTVDRAAGKIPVIAGTGSNNTAHAIMMSKEAQKLGWEGGSLEPYAPNCCIGGSRFGNYEGILPEKPGREYTECDIDTLGKKSRGAKRIVFSNDGLIYYTDDHYKTFELLYGEE